MKISVDQLEKSRERFYTWEDQRSKGVSTRAIIMPHELEADIAPEITDGNIIGDQENLLRRREMIMASGHEPLDFAFERAIGKNDSVYSNFVELLLHAKSKVGRIILRDGNAVKGYATGFMVSENLLLTNWHVFENRAEAQDSLVQFYYELDAAGNPMASVNFALAPQAFFFSVRDLDYCLVAVEPADTSGKFMLKDIGYIYLDPTLGKLGNENEELLNIIHHPDGDYKQLSIRENKFTRIMPTTLWYESDTAQGSSGSPVFNDQWQVVALHHMGVAKKNAAGEYIDKDDKVIPIIDGKIDVSKVVWQANEGVRISVIRNHLVSVFPHSPIVQKMLNPPVGDHNGVLPRTHGEISQGGVGSATDKEIVHITIPRDLLERNRTVNFNITTNPLLGTSQGVDTYGTGQALTPEGILAAESLRLERTIDYSECDGYRSDFLGDDFRVPIPKASAAIRNHIAKLTGTRAYILRYHKFSVIHNALRRMPMISAINVDGDADKRQDFTERDDVWIRDRRIDLDVQLNNDFYYKSGFDRGHMTRREDANWGNTPSEAKRNADMTCVHTNACPQVPNLNRSRWGGLWGKLETIVLEHGAKKEDGRTGKISVFSGPIHKETDPIFRGVKIPMEYFKIILWLTDDDELRATAFKLSQSDLVEEIDFEEIGIDEDITFKPFQASIESLEEATKIDFERVKPFDTFQGDGDVDIDNEEAVRAIVSAPIA